MAIAVGEAAPSVSGVDLDPPHALVFFKVTCGTTQLATPAIERLAQAYRGRVAGVGQDAPSDLASFAGSYGLSLPLVPDLDPYVASDAYGIVSAPTVIVVDADRRVADAVESWDRDGWNRVSSTLAGLLAARPVAVSDPGDGLPGFKPG